MKNTNNGGIPKEWIKNDLSNISKIIMGQSPSSEFVNNKEIGKPFLQGNAEFSTKHPIPNRWVSKFSKKCEKLDILISVRAPVGELNIADREYCIGRGLAAIRFTTCDKNFGWYLLHFHRNQLSIKAQGSTFTAINRADLESIQLQIPHSILEQTQIATILSTIDETIDQTDWLIQKYQRIKQGMMQDLFRFGIDEQGNLRSEKTHRFKNSPLGKIPEEWAIIPLNQIFCEIHNKYSNFKNKLNPIPILSMTRYDGLVLQTEKFGKRVASADLSNYKIVKRGEFVIGFPIDEGVIFALKQHPLGLVSPVYTVWQIIHDSIDINFIDKLLKIPSMINKYKIVMNHSVERRKTIRRKDFLNVNTIIPPFPEQQRIIYVLSHVENIIQQEESYKQKLITLKAGLMNDLLSGKVRVNHFIPAEAVA